MVSGTAFFRKKIGVRHRFFFVFSQNRVPDTPNFPQFSSKNRFSLEISALNVLKYK
jgi:hypothetical protein